MQNAERAYRHQLGRTVKSQLPNGKIVCQRTDRQNNNNSNTFYIEK